MRRVLSTRRQLTVALLCVASCSCACRTQPMAQSLASQENPVVADVLGKRILLSQEDRLRGIILGALLEKYATEHKIEPSRSEIDAYIAYHDSVLHEHEQKPRPKQEIIDEIIGKLQAISQLDDDDGVHAEYLKRLNIMLDADRKMVESSNERLREQLDKQRQRMGETLAKKSILRCNVDLALFRQYGGRVIFQQAGPEPLDAYRDFLKEHERRGSFHILDEKLAPTFWDYFVNDDMHIFLSETREEGLEILTPPWRHTQGPNGE